MASDHFVHRRVARVEEAVEVAAAPAGDQVDADVERRGDPSEDPERATIEVSALEERHFRARNRRSLRDVLLPPTAADPHRAECSADTLVFHVVTLTRET